MTKAVAHLRIEIGPDAVIGPGKADLLERIAATGSIAAGGAALGMSYARAWRLAREMNDAFREPLVARLRGGAGGGGAMLTPLGVRVLDAYRRMQATAEAAVAAEVAALRQALKD